MVEIGKMKIDNEKYNTAVIFFLQKEARITYDTILNIDNTDWHVKVVKGTFAVCAMTNKIKKNKDSYFKSAYRAIQQFLDILSLIKKPVLSLDYDKNEQISLFVFNNDSYRIFEVKTKEFLKFDGDAEIVVKDLDGNIKKPIITASYDPAVRYFRMSQLSEGILDAYRYLFLSVESALNTFDKHKGNSKEGEWFGDAVEKANSKSKAPLKYKDGIKKHFQDYQYHKMRNKLFHSKGKTILPFDNYDVSEIYNAYIDLFDICAMIFEVQFNQNIKGGFHVTEHAVKIGIESIRIDNINFFNQEKKLEDVVEIKQMNQLKAKGYTGNLKIKLRNLDVDNQMLFNRYDLTSKNNTMIFTEFKEEIKLIKIDTIIINHSILFTNRNIIDRPFLW